MTGRRGVGSEFAARAGRLRVDAQGATVRHEFGAAGIPCILLKGRAFAELLYDPDEFRSYGDCDLLIPERDHLRATALLRELGFCNLSVHGTDLAPDPLHAEHWRHGVNGTQIDMHVRLLGTFAPAMRVWTELDARTTTQTIGGRPTRVLDPVGSALLCALHVAQHPLGLPGPHEDLKRALQRLPRSVWSEAAELAGKLEATAAFTDGLRLSECGGGLADDLGLAPVATLGRRLSTGDGPWGATALQWMIQHRRPRDRVRLVVRVVFPPPPEMRKFSRLARGGPGWLALAYTLRPLVVLRKAPAAVAHWRAVRGPGLRSERARRTRRSSDTPPDARHP